MTDAAVAVEVPARSASSGLAWVLELGALVLLVGGTVGGLFWSSAVERALPGWFDPGEACEGRFGAGDVHAETSTFPVAASCVYAEGAVVHDYVAPAEPTGSPCSAPAGCWPR